jgi:DNA-binding response OmpR family regulator
MRLLLVARRPLARRVRPVLEAEGIGAVEATGVRQADAEAQSGGYDAVLLDASLLGDRGPGRLMRWRVNGLSCDALVLLPPSSTSTERAAWLNAGADGCLLGPLGTAELLAQLRALRRRSGAPRVSAIRLHDLEIDPVAQTVRRAGRTIELSPREFDLLVLLARRPGRVVSRAAIRAHLYADQAGERSNVVDVYIGYLREKIDKGSDNPLIQTRWGQGYLLRPEG